MRKVVALALAMITLLTVLALPVSAADGTGTYGTDWVKYGDLTIDEKIDAKDALSVLKFSVGKELLSETQRVVADVNVDTFINAKDALEILKYTVGKVVTFPAGTVYQITGGGSSDEPPAPVENDYIQTYDRSNSVNGAYVADKTADTSFKVNPDVLAKNTVYKVVTSAWTKKAGVADTVDIQRMLFSLQGLVNRDFGMDADHTALIFVPGDGASDNEWLKQMQHAESIMASASNNSEGMAVITVRNWANIEQYFVPMLKETGIILWDGNVPATANVAATICGLDGYVPVLKDSPLHKTLVAAGVPVKQDLSGLFKDGNKGRQITGTNVQSTGSAKNDAYLWALEKYFSRCSTKYIAYTLDGAPTVKDYAAYQDNPTALLGDAGANCLSNHDYLIARRCFFFDLDPYAQQAACDDPAQKNGQAAIGTDHQTMIKIFERRYARANGEFGALMGFIPWWLKYTDHHGNSQKAGTWLEWMFCEIISCYNLAKEADAAHPCSMYNGSFMYKYIPKAKSYENNNKKEDLIYNPTMYYYTIYVGDYDSSAWLKKHIYDMWIARNGDRNRGSVTMMWSVNPNLADRIPIVFEYMYENKTDADYFAGGDGGAGYIIPEGLFTGRTMVYSGIQRPSSYGNGDAAFTRLSKPYYERFDMDITGFVINGDHRTLTKEVAAAIASYSPALNFTTCYKNPIARYGNTYFVYCQNDLNKSNATNGNNSPTMWTYRNNFMKGGSFGAYRTICWTPTEVKQCTEDFATYAKEKGLTVKYCDPYTYLGFLKSANNAQVLG